MDEMQCNTKLLKQGAEAKLYTCDFYGRPAIIKERFIKTYRHPNLDKSLSVQRTKAEVRAMQRCRSNGILTPTIYFVDLDERKIVMEYFSSSITVKDYINNSLLESKEQSANAFSSDSKTNASETIMPVKRPSSEFDNISNKGILFSNNLRNLALKIGKIIANMHVKNVIHGDLTTSNLLLVGQPENMNIVVIDFGLSSVENLAEDKGVDLYVLERAFLSSHPNTEELFSIILESYKKQYGSGVEEIISKLDEVRLRGRKRTMVG